MAEQTETLVDVEVEIPDDLYNSLKPHAEALKVTVEELIAAIITDYVKEHRNDKGEG